MSFIFLLTLNGIFLVCRALKQKVQRKYGRRGGLRKVLGEGWEHKREWCARMKKCIFYISIFILTVHSMQNGKLHRKKNTFQQCSFFLSLQDEGWCLSLLSAKGPALGGGAENAPQACLMCWISMKLLLGPPGQWTASLVRLPELTGDAWEQNNCRGNATNRINKMAYLNLFCVFDNHICNWHQASGEGISNVELLQI